MANLTIIKNLIKYTIDSKSSENSQWPVSNLLEFDKRIRFWKTTDTTEQWVILDFTTAKALNSVALIDCNFTSYKIQGNTTTTFTSPPFDWTGLVTAQEKFADAYRSNKNPQNPASPNPAFNYRYLRLVIPSQSTTDGATEFRLGVLLASIDSEAMLINPKWGVEFIRDQGEVEAELHGGGLEYATTGAAFLRLNFDILRLRTSADFTQLAKQLISIGKGELISFFFDDQIREDAASDQYVYVMQRVNKPKYRIEAGRGEMPGISLREAI